MPLSEPSLRDSLQGSGAPRGRALSNHTALSAPNSSSRHLSNPPTLQCRSLRGRTEPPRGASTQRAHRASTQSFHTEGVQSLYGEPPRRASTERAYRASTGEPPHRGRTEPPRVQSLYGETLRRTSTRRPPALTVIQAV